MFGCTSDLDQRTAARRDRPRGRVWHGLTGDGTPAPAGLYHVKLLFPFLVRQAAPPFKGDAMADQHPIALDAGFEVAGAPWSGITSAQAIDRALADARVKAWIADALPRTRVGGARIRLTEGGSWRFEIDRMTADGLDNEVATIEVDPTTGAVTTVTLRPPDRARLPAGDSSETGRPKNPPRARRSRCKAPRRPSERTRTTAVRAEHRSGNAADRPHGARPIEAAIHRGAVLGGELAVPCTCNPLQQG